MHHITYENIVDMAKLDRCQPDTFDCNGSKPQHGGHLNYITLWYMQTCYKKNIVMPRVFYVECYYLHY